MLKTLIEGKGNYRRKYNKQGIEIFTYFNNPICYVNHKNKTFSLDDCGYGNYRSTVRALNDLRKYCNNKGYEEE